jgi:hypothetical protein
MIEPLPEGYAIKQNGLLFFVQKNGATLRRAPRGRLKIGVPIAFRDYSKAIAHARQDNELGLEANQQVPNSG